MGGFRALTKYNNNDSQKRTFKRTQTQAQTSKAQEPKQQKDLKLVTVTAEQESTKAVKFVFDELPTSKLAIDALITKELKTKEHTLIGL